MQTVTEATLARKPAKAFHAQFDGLSGVLTRTAEGRILFLEHESRAVVTITQADASHLVVLGEVATAISQLVLDLVQSRAGVVCGRGQEIQ